MRARAAPPGARQRLAGHAPAAVDREGNRQREIALSERRDRLRRAVLAHDEVVAREPGDRLTVRVGDGGVDLDHVHAALELRTRLLRGAGDAGEQRQGEQGPRPAAGAPGGTMAAKEPPDGKPRIS
jgi:hypothetical protein